MKPDVDFVLGHFIAVIPIFMGLNRNGINLNSNDKCAQVSGKKKNNCDFFFCKITI